MSKYLKKIWFPLAITYLLALLVYHIIQDEDWIIRLTDILIALSIGSSLTTAYLSKELDAFEKELKFFRYTVKEEDK